MQDRDDMRGQAVERLQSSRERRAACSERYESARGSAEELPAFTQFRVAEDQFAAREAWLKWIDRDY
jgi:hypothetical protein